MKADKRTHLKTEIVGLQITQKKIRQLLTELKELTGNISGRDLDPDIFWLVSQALTLLPCETCGNHPCSLGCQGHITHPCENCGQQWGGDKPCPDCQS